MPLVSTNPPAALGANGARRRPMRGAVGRQSNAEGLRNFALETAASEMQCWKCNIRKGRVSNGRDREGPRDKYAAIQTHHGQNRGRRDTPRRPEGVSPAQACFPGAPMSQGRGNRLVSYHLIRVRRLKFDVNIDCPSRNKTDATRVTTERSRSSNQGTGQEIARICAGRQYAWVNGAGADQYKDGLHSLVLNNRAQRYNTYCTNTSDN